KHVRIYRVPTRGPDRDPATHPQMVREQMLERLVEHPPLVNCTGEAPTLGLKRHLGLHRVLLPVTRGLPAFSPVHFIGFRPLGPFHRAQTPLSLPVDIP